MFDLVFLFRFLDSNSLPGANQRYYFFWGTSLKSVALKALRWQKKHNNKLKRTESKVNFDFKRVRKYEPNEYIMDNINLLGD